MTIETIKHHILTALADVKAQDVTTLDVHQLTNMADYMIICTGTSQRHIKALADNVVMELKRQHVRPLGVEGTPASGWLLIDVGDIVVHIMLQEKRDFYRLEERWTEPCDA